MTMMFEVGLLFCVETDTVTVMLCDSFVFGSLAIWVTDDIECKVTKLNFCFQSVSLHYVTKTNNVNDVVHTAGEKREMSVKFDRGHPLRGRRMQVGWSKSATFDK